MKKFLKYGAITLGVLILLGVVFGGGDTDTTTTTSTNNNSEESQEADTEEKLYSLGETVVVEDRVAWTITGAEDLGQTLKSGNQFIDDETTTGRFIKVSGQVENVSSEELMFDAPALIDAEGREFSTYSQSFSFIDESQKINWFDTFNPGISKTFSEIYEVPANAEELRFEATNLGTFNIETALIDLGL